MSDVVQLKVAMACQVRSNGSRFAWGAQPRVCRLLVLPMPVQVRPARCPPPLNRRLPLQPSNLQGCVGAVQRVAEKIEGVTGVDIDLGAQKVRLRCCCSRLPAAPPVAGCSGMLGGPLPLLLPLAVPMPSSTAAEGSSTPCPPLPNECHHRSL